MTGGQSDPQSSDGKNVERSHQEKKELEYLGHLLKSVLKGKVYDRRRGISWFSKPTTKLFKGASIRNEQILEEEKEYQNHFPNTVDIYSIKQEVVADAFKHLGQIVKDPGRLHASRFSINTLSTFYIWTCIYLLTLSTRIISFKFERRLIIDNELKSENLLDPCRLNYHLNKMKLVENTDRFFVHRMQVNLHRLSTSQQGFTLKVELINKYFSAITTVLPKKYLKSCLKFLVA